MPRRLRPWSPPRGRVLALAAHPDDETLGCGGALALHRLRGDPVTVVIVTDGAAGDPRGRYRGRDYPALRRAEARAAARLLGLGEPVFWDFPDGALTGARGLSARLRALLAAGRPAVVYRPAADDPHPDHRALARAFERAARGLRGRRFADCRYEVTALPPPDVVVDVGAVFARKAAAIRRYRTQLHDTDYAALARRAASKRALYIPGARWAEAFRLPR